MLFFTDYNRPGPGIPENAPRKTGLPRIGEMISRDYKTFWLAGILNIFASLPFIFQCGLSFVTHSLMIAMLGGVLGGMIAAPTIYGLADTLLLSLRDQYCHWWDRYRKTIQSNWLKTLLPGGIAGLIFSMQIFILLHLSVLGYGIFMLLCQLISMTVFLGIFLWTLAQRTLLELSFTSALKNSFLLFFRYIKSSLAASAAALIYVLAVLMIFPGSIFLLIIFGIWLPLLCCFQVIYPKLNEIFSIESQISEKTAAAKKAENR